jgi:hypothetical protein
MLFKIITFIVVAAPIVLFLRAILFRRSTRWSAALKELKQRIDFAVTFFLWVAACVVVMVFGKMIWTWWSGS